MTMAQRIMGVVVGGGGCGRGKEKKGIHFIFISNFIIIYLEQIYTFLKKNWEYICNKFFIFLLFK